MPNGGYPMHFFIKPQANELLFHVDGDSLAIRNVAYRENGHWYAAETLVSIPREIAEGVVAHLVRWMAIRDGRESDIESFVAEIIAGGLLVPLRQDDGFDVKYDY